MKRYALAAVLLLSTPFAHAAPPTQAQLDKLLQVMDMEKMLDQILVQIEASSREMGSTMLGENASQQDRARFDRIMAQQNQSVRKALSWDKLAPIYRTVYADVFTDDEVQAMTDFYASERGRSILQKMPQAMNRSMQEMQPIMQSVMQETMRTIEAELKNAKTETAEPAVVK